MRGGAGRWNCSFLHLAWVQHRCSPSEELPGWERLSSVRGSAGVGVCMCGGAAPALPGPKPTALTPFPHTPAPFPPSRSSVASLLSQPILLCKPRSFHIIPWQKECLPPTPCPATRERSSPLGPALPSRSPPGIPRLPGHPHPRPGCPSPAPAEVGLCTHPLPAAVALSLETGSDSGSITFSALSLSGNFCGNPSEKGGQAGLWVHPSQELSSLPL